MKGSNAVEPHCNVALQHRAKPKQSHIAMWLYNTVLNSNQATL
jgi:hypothetical protein